MRHLTPQHEHSRRAAKPFAKFALLVSSLAVLAGCSSSDWKPELREWLPGLFQDSISVRRQEKALLQMEQTLDDNLRMKMIASRLITRHTIAARIAYAQRFPLKYGLTDDSTSLFIAALVMHGTVSQVSSEYDTAAIKLLGIYAISLPRQPATEAVEQLIAIMEISAKNSVSRRLAKAVLGYALGNPALEQVTKWKIALVCKGESVVPLCIVEMPPCCESPQQSHQTPLDSLAMRMMAGR